MAASLMERILRVHLERLSQITRANGYETDAGEAIYLGEVPALGKDDPKEGIAIVMGEQEATFVGVNVRMEWPIEFHAIAFAEIEEPWMSVVRIVSDIWRAIEQSDRTLGGLIRETHGFRGGSARFVERESGSTTVAAVVTYTHPFTRAYGGA